MIRGAARLAGRSLVLGLVAASAGCAARGLTLPSGDGQPFPAYEAALEEAAGPCRQARTLTAELGVSGRVARQKLRGRLLAGFERPASMRLEGVAPFGPPAFILVSSEGRATLLLPRDRAVLTGEAPEAILEALVGIELPPSRLLSILSGCGVTLDGPTGGVTFPQGWARVDFEGDRALFLRQEAGRWRIEAALAPPLRVEYSEHQAGRPASIRLRLEGEGDGADPRVDLRLRVSQVRLNTEISPAAFTVRVPPGADAITLAELREAGPLGQR